MGKKFRLDNPLDSKATEKGIAKKSKDPLYEQMLKRGEDLLEKPLKGGGEEKVRLQHNKGRMTVWERIKVLTSEEPHITFQNWGS